MTPAFVIAPEAASVEGDDQPFRSAPAGATSSAAQFAAPRTVTGPSRITSSVDAGGTPPIHVDPAVHKPPAVVEVIVAACAWRERMIVAASDDAKSAGTSMRISPEVERSRRVMTSSLLA